MIIFGLTPFFRRRVACKAAHCTVCQEPRVAVGMRSLVCLHLFYIPLMPAGLFVDWVCWTCGQEVDAERPVRAEWSVRVFTIGSLFLWAGLVGVGGFWAKPGDSSPYPAFIIGCVVVAALVAYWRRAQRRRDEEDAATVEALPGERCPLCDQAVLLPGKPRCQACGVDILTGDLAKPPRA